MGSLVFAENNQCLPFSCLGTHSPHAWWMFSSGSGHLRAFCFHPQHFCPCFSFLAISQTCYMRSHLRTLLFPWSETSPQPSSRMFVPHLVQMLPQISSFLWVLPWPPDFLFPSLCYFSPSYLSRWDILYKVFIHLFTVVFPYLNIYLWGQGFLSMFFFYHPHLEQCLAHCRSLPIFEWMATVCVLFSALCLVAWKWKILIWQLDVKILPQNVWQLGVEMEEGRGR